MARQTRYLRRISMLIWIIFVGFLVTELPICSTPGVWAAPSPAPSTAKAKGDSERGKKIFNGKGFCYQCHGIDGYISRRPQMAPEMAQMLDRLKPKPADFRNPASLKSKDDKDRFTAIKEGHPGTAMFPKPFLSDEEIADVLVYLAELRAEAGFQSKSKAS
jgi:cytochrome c2